MAAHFKGLGYMEQYEYARGRRAFREVHRRAPGWIPGAINLAIALLNDSGVKPNRPRKRGRKLPRATSTRPSICWPASWNEIRQPARSFLPGHHPRAARASRRRSSPFQAGDRDRPQRRGRLVLDGKHLARPERSHSARRSRAGQRADRTVCESPRAQSLPDPRDIQDGVGLCLRRPASKTEGVACPLDQDESRSPGPTPGPGDAAEKKYGEMGKYATVVNPFPLAQSGTEQGNPAAI